MQEKHKTELRELVTKQLDKFLRGNPDCNGTHSPKQQKPFVLEVPKGIEKRLLR